MASVRAVSGLVTNEGPMTDGSAHLYFSLTFWSIMGWQEGRWFNILEIWVWVQFMHLEAQWWGNYNSLQVSSFTSYIAKYLELSYFHFANNE